MWNKANRGLIFIISGPSGSGKTTLAKSLLKQPQLKDKFIKPVSFTTRPRRPRERQGRDYHFVSVKEFQELFETKKILERTYYLGYDYGTPRDSVERAVKKGLNIVLCLDIKGASFIKKAYPGRVVTIFVKPPSLGVAKTRIAERSHRTMPAEIDRRIRLAKKEMGYVNRYDYYLVNNNLSEAISELKRIVKRVLSTQNNR